MRNIYPQPGFTDVDLTDLLATREFVYADLYTILLQSGETIRVTSAQQDVTVFPIGTPIIRTYLSDYILVSGLQFKIGVGVEIDEQQVRLVYRDDTLVPDRLTPMLIALRRGDFDGARITKDRVYSPNWRSPWVGGVRLFSGRTGSVSDIGRTECNMNVRSDLALLNINMPRNLFQSSCTHTLYDGGCKLAKGSFLTVGYVETGSTNRVIKWAGATATPPFDLGVIYLENQDNVTFSRTIRKATADSLILSFPLDFVPAVGSEFSAYPGCPRTMDACNVFGNIENFKGFPFVPLPESAY